MFAIFFKSTETDQDFESTMALAKQTLMGRVETMLERDATRKMRFTTIDNDLVHLR
jgi:hypothetical protein